MTKHRDVLQHIKAAADSDLATDRVVEADKRTAEVIPEQHRTFVQRGLDQAAAGDFASQEEVEAVYRRFGS